MSQWPTTEDIAELRKWHEETMHIPYRAFPQGAVRDRLRRWRLIERWNPTLKATGRVKPWRLTSAGYAALREPSDV